MSVLPILGTRREREGEVLGAVEGDDEQEEAAGAHEEDEVAMESEAVSRALALRGW